MVESPDFKMTNINLTPDFNLTNINLTLGYGSPAYEPSCEIRSGQWTSVRLRKGWMYEVRRGDSNRELVSLNLERVIRVIHSVNRSNETSLIVVHFKRVK